MRLELNLNKQEIRQEIIQQIFQELSFDTRDAYIVSLPADCWIFEEELIAMLQGHFPEKQFTLHCFENELARFNSTLQKESDNELPFVVDRRENYFMSGSNENVKVIYQYGNLDMESTNPKKDEKFIAWNDFCGIPYRDRGVNLLAKMLEQKRDALIYQTHSVSLRNYVCATRLHDGVVPEMKLMPGHPHYNGIAFANYFNDGRRMQKMPRAEVYYNVYKGGALSHNPMMTIGWRTGTKKVSHIEKVDKEY